MSPSSRSGTTKVSLLRAKEFDFERDPGEAFRAMGSEPCRNRFRLRKPPRLVLPDIDVEFRPLARVGGVGGVVSSECLPSELMVDDLSRKPNLLGGTRVGDE